MMRVDEMVTLYGVLKRLENVRMSFDGCHAVIRNIGALEPSYKAFAKNLADLVEEYGPKSADGKLLIDEENQVHFSDFAKENFRKFEEELQKLHEQTVSGVELMRFSENDLRNLYEITPAEWKVLDAYVLE